MDGTPSSVPPRVETPHSLAPLQTHSQLVASPEQPRTPTPQSQQIQQSQSQYPSLNPDSYSSSSPYRLDCGAGIGQGIENEGEVYDQEESNCVTNPEPEHQNQYIPQLQDLATYDLQQALIVSQLHHLQTNNNNFYENFHMMNQSHHQQSEMYYPQYQTQQYNPYPYSTNGAHTPAVSTPMPGPQNVLPVPSALSNQGAMPQAAYSNNAPAGNFDTTGQHNPPGMKPRVTATLWEDEGSLCFQVEARGICVARREDNHMINGTKLLNVAGMTRGRRDGILKSEKVRHVVKIGPMHLKGVWIPYDRALDFANKEKITELLYPLFVHNIGALLYHPSNSNRTSQVMAAAERKKNEAIVGNRSLPSLVQSHHQMMPGMPTGYTSQQPLTNGHQSMTNTPQPLTNGAQPPMNGSQTPMNGPQPPMQNGGGMLKRVREEDDELHRSAPNGHDPMNNMHGMPNGYPHQSPLGSVHQPPMQNGNDGLKRGREEHDDIHRAGPNGHDPMNNMPGGMPSLPTYAPPPLQNLHQPLSNGDGGMLKRGRDDDDDVHRSSPNGHDGNGNFELKRRKTETSASNDMLPQSPYYTLSTNGAYQGPMMNGMNPYKRRDDEAETPRPGPNMNDLSNNFDLKQRHKTMESSVPAPQYDAMNRPHSSIGNSPAYASAPTGYDHLTRPASTVAVSPAYPTATGYELARPGTNVPRRQQSFS